MSPVERAFFARLQRRAAMLTPQIGAALLAAYAILRDGTTDDDFAKLVRFGFVERWLDQVLSQALIDVAMAPVRDVIRKGILESFKYVARELPKPPPSARALTVVFDVLNPRVITAIRALETRVITTLDTSIRETVRLAIEQGVRDGLGPRVIARSLRSVIGLAPHQLQEVQNFRRALMGEDGRSPFSYTLRDTRFDGTIRKGPLTPEQIDKMVTAYTKRRIAQNAETNARTASLDALKLGQRLAWQDAVEKGIVDGNRLRHMWIGVMDARERPKHVAMEHESRPWNQPYSNGQLIPGDTDFNCRCIDRFYLAAA